MVLKRDIDQKLIKRLKPIANERPPLLCDTKYGGLALMRQDFAENALLLPQSRSAYEVIGGAIVHWTSRMSRYLSKA